MSIVDWVYLDLDDYTQSTSDNFFENIAGAPFFLGVPRRIWSCIMRPTGPRSRTGGGRFSTKLWPPQSKGPFEKLIFKIPIRLFICCYCMLYIHIYTYVCIYIYASILIVNQFARPSICWSPNWWSWKKVENQLVGLPCDQYSWLVLTDPLVLTHTEYSYRWTNTTYVAHVTNIVDITICCY